MKIRLVGISAIALVAVCATLARAEDISAKKILIKDNATKPAKKHVLVQSADPGIQFSEIGDPGTNGASLHLYSATDDMCVILPAGTNWKLKKSTWRYRSKATKNQAIVKSGSLTVKINSGITYTLIDNVTQGHVNAQVQFGTGTRYCMRCSGNKKDVATTFLGKNCAAAPCDPEPTTCGSASTTTTTLPLPSRGGVVLKGALTATPGRFNYNLTLGLPGANSACSTTFPGTHACTHADLQSAATAGDLVGLKDTSNASVTSFWAIDSSQPALQQCNDDVVSGLNWEYATAHTMSRGEQVALNNTTGALGPLQMGVQCNIAGTSWVGCCQ